MQDGVSVKEGGIRGGNGLERGFILREGRKDFGGA
jgi:hypothetical protein